VHEFFYLYLGFKKKHIKKVFMLIFFIGKKIFNPWWRARKKARIKLYKVNFKAILEKQGKRELNLILGPTYG
jgi:hypothetical protein